MHALFAIVASVYGAMPEVSLDYLVAPGLTCPPRATLEASVAARLGASPFRAPSDAPTGDLMVIAIRVDADGAGLVATMNIRDEAGDAGHRELRSATADCRELAEALVVALVVAIDPFAETQTSTRAAPRTILVPVSPDPPPPSPEVELTLFAGLSAALGVVPGAGLGAVFGLDVAYERFAVALGGAVSLPSDALVDGTRAGVSVLSISADLAACFAPARYSVCALGRAGIHRATPFGLEAPDPTTTPDFALGARAGVVPVVVGDLSWWVGLEAAARLNRTTLRASGTPIWTTPDGFVGLRTELRWSLR